MDVACTGGSAVEGCIDALEPRDASLKHRRDLRVVADVATPGRSWQVLADSFARE